MGKTYLNPWFLALLFLHGTTKSLLFLQLLVFIMTLDLICLERSHCWFKIKTIKYVVTSNGSFSTFSDFLKESGKAGEGISEWGNNMSEIHGGTLWAARGKAPGSRLICFVICFSGERHSEDREAKVVFLSASCNRPYCPFRMQTESFLVLLRVCTCSILSHLSSAFVATGLCVAVLINAQVRNTH